MLRLIIGKAFWDSAKKLKQFLRFSFHSVFNSYYDSIDYVVNDEKKIVYIVNSKCGCSTFKRTLALNDEFDGENINYQEIHKRTKEKGLITKVLSEEQRKYFRFTFVRNPYKRIVSLYINKFLDNDKINDGLGFEYSSYLGGYINREISFEQFVKLIVVIPNNLAERHFMKQSDLVYNQSEKIDYIGKLEDYSNDIIDLESKLGFKMSNGNESRKENQSKTYNYMDYYTKETFELLHEFYKKDVEKFEYLEEEKELKTHLGIK
ncbi:hypothetical protein GCM10007978_40520 [Shewanella hanedai]|uniref:Sulfotransferase family protein n=1 Tax=Shewanella hanedai TaxID=25 RepID=A0A553JMN4_SHEHA|nr:sulfotransferase family 2 domain-containing protein [Shewanella hanedai]TRY13681.1 sulfotransferase family protein [Shewanella hanedai]GGI98603.1 hypothetical protein GCM10007978_40520 [Shewanella hanedai]